jgi:pimeloyl-ACP methyl ester carboxylesterase
VDRALKTPKYAACESLREFCSNYDIQDKISNIKVSTLIIVGDKDTSTPVSMSRYLRTQIEFSKLAIVPDSKHMPVIEQAEMVNEVINEFLRTCYESVITSIQNTENFSQRPNTNF